VQAPVNALAAPCKEQKENLKEKDGAAKMKPCWRKDGSRVVSRLVEIELSEESEKSEDGSSRGVSLPRTLSEEEEEEEQQQQQQQQLQHEKAAIDTFEEITCFSSSSSPVFASTRTRDNERDFGLQVDLSVFTNTLFCLASFCLFYIMLLHVNVRGLSRHVRRIRAGDVCAARVRDAGADCLAHSPRRASFSARSLAAAPCCAIFVAQSLT